MGRGRLCVTKGNWVWEEEDYAYQRGIGYGKRETMRNKGELGMEVGKVENYVPIATLSPPERLLH